jgi:hypothetical protein
MYKCLKLKNLIESLKEDAMKKLLVVLMVLSIATIANAGLVISGAPTGVLQANDTASLSITGDSLTTAPTDVYLIAVGNGTVGGGAVVGTIWDLTKTEIKQSDAAMLAYLGNMNGYPEVGFNASSAVWMNAVPLDAVVNGTYAGTIANSFTFTCTGNGDVAVSLVNITQAWNDDLGGFDAPVFTTFDSVTIHQIPEPITMTLLGLGGLFLRRRSK